MSFLKPVETETLETSVERIHLPEGDSPFVVFTNNIGLLEGDDENFAQIFWRFEVDKASVYYKRQWKTDGTETEVLMLHGDGVKRKTIWREERDFTQKNGEE